MFFSSSFLWLTWSLQGITLVINSTFSQNQSIHGNLRVSWRNFTRSWICWKIRLLGAIWRKCLSDETFDLLILNFSNTSEQMQDLLIITWNVLLLKTKPNNNTCPATLIEFYSLENPRLWGEFAWEILQSLSFPLSSSKSVVTSRHTLSNFPFRCLDCFVISPWNRMLRSF